MQTIHMVICNSGDGSNHIEWVIDHPAVIDHIQALADDGDERYASGDGLQIRALKFPDGFDIEAWLELNNWSLTTLSDFE